MWPRVLRDPKDYGNDYPRDGETYASAACAKLHGFTDDGPVGSGSLVNTSLHQCTVLTHIRPIPSYVENRGGGKNVSNYTNASKAAHAAAASANLAANVSSNIQQYDCAYSSNGFFDKPLNGGVLHLSYGVRASPSCFSDLGGWSSSDCSCERQHDFSAYQTIGIYRRVQTSRCNSWL